jgi:RHS repeat-associated protein
MFEWRQHESAAESTVYVDELYERRRTSSGSEEHVFHVYAGGREVAQVTRAASTGTEEVRYLHRDQQGSVSLVTSSDGDVVTREDFGPFGERINLDGSRKEALMSGVSFGYTGHEHDDELGLINMRGRVYDPMARKFLTPDPIVSDVMVGGSWNPYSYVQNNPIRFVDPSGLCTTIFGFEIWGCGSGSDPTKDAGPKTPTGKPPAPEPQSPPAGAGGTLSTHSPAAPKETPAAGGTAPNVDGSRGTPSTSSPPRPQHKDEPAGVLLQFSAGGSWSEGDEPPRIIEQGVQGVPASPNQSTTGAGMEEFAEALELGGACAATGCVPFLVADTPREDLALSEEQLGNWTIVAGAGVVKLIPTTPPRAPTIDTAAVRFTQSSVKGTFSDGRTLQSTIDALKGPGGDAVAQAIPPIRIFKEGGVLKTLDNRRLLAFSESGRPVPYVWATPAELAAEAWKFTATPQQMGGWFIRVKP